MTPETILKKASAWAYEKAHANSDLEAFMDKLPMDNGQFSRLFHAVFNMTFSHYIRRIIVAKTLMAVQSNPEAQDAIIQKAGFADQVSFFSLLGIEDATDSLTLAPEPFFPKKTFELAPMTQPLAYDIITIKAKDFLGLAYKGHHHETFVKENWAKLPAILTDVKASFAPFYSGLQTPIRDYFFDINDSQSGAFEYISACEVFDFGKTPKALTYKAVPQRTYLRVVHTDKHGDLKETYQRIYAYLMTEANVFYEEDYVIEKFVNNDENQAIHIHIPITQKKPKKRRL